LICFLFFVAVNNSSAPGAGLVVETGSGTALLDLPGTSLDQVRHIAGDPGLSTLRLPRAPAMAPPLARDVDLEVCFVCKHCKVAFLTDHALLAHQRQICYAGRETERGVIRVVQIGLECRVCPGAEKFKTLQEFRKHTETETHHRNHVPPKVGLPPPESPLSHEMEDVVNQITLLAARAAQESPASGNKDSNANIQREFCAPGPAKPRFPPPGELLQQASAGH
jgi:hypothetical protein